MKVTFVKVRGVIPLVMDCRRRLDLGIVAWLGKDAGDVQAGNWGVWRLTALRRADAEGLFVAVGAAVGR